MRPSHGLSRERGLPAQLVDVPWLKVERSEDQCFVIGVRYIQSGKRLLHRPGAAQIQLIQNIFDVHHQFCALLESPVGEDARRRVDTPWHTKDVPALLKS